MRLDTSSAKTEYTVEEAAQELGISSGELRSLLVRHVLDDPEGLRNLPKMRFRRSDLVMLSLVVSSIPS